MIVALDVDYDDGANLARVGAVVFAEWSDAAAAHEHRVTHHGIAAYRSGAFYERELPCLRHALDDLPDRFTIATVVVDGHVDLGSGRAGLGRHLYDAYEGAFEVVGVAKNPRPGAVAREVLRGTSRRPLFVGSTADLAAAAARVASMAGAHRIPDLLRRVDHLARGRRRPS